MQKKKYKDDTVPPRGVDNNTVQLASELPSGESIEESVDGGVLEGTEDERNFLQNEDGNIYS